VFKLRCDLEPTSRLRRNSPSCFDCEIVSAHGVFSCTVKDIYDILGEWRKSRYHPGGLHALATLVRVEGSSYRRPGARMLIWPDGKTIGSLSAGCLEEEVTLRAREVFETGDPAVMSFDTRRRFGCAGRIDIFVERAHEKFFIDLAKELDARRPCVAITRFSGDKVGTQIVGIDYEHPPSRSYGVAGEQEHEHEFIQEIHPPMRLWIFGDGPDNAPFYSLGQPLGWEVNAFIDATVLTLAPDRWTAAIVKSHNFGRDFAALQKLLPLNLRYVGLIGPRKRRDQLMNDLLDREIAVNSGFFAPAGLDLGSETPEEIALSIIAEIQRVFATGSGESLRERKRSIHAPTGNAVLA
jgi:xanthine dehydrogenase accessory factor